MFFELGLERYQPIKLDHVQLRQQHLIASTIGLVMVLLPVSLLIIYFSGECFRDSISQFYYGRISGDLLVISLAMLGFLLILFKGEHKKEQRLSTYAGIGALLVALVPARGNGLQEGMDCSGRSFVGDQSANCIIPDYQAFPNAGFIHVVGAFVFLGVLMIFSLHFFSRFVAKGENSGTTDYANKIVRNSVYFTMNVISVFSISALLLFALLGRDWVWWNKVNLTFWTETFALISMGICWLVKGRLFGVLLLDEREKPMT